MNLPVFGFGAAHLGELYGKVDEADSRATLDAAWDAGVRYYDTAPWYGRGLSEHRLGGFLRTKPRDEFQITTKVGRYARPPEGPGDLRPLALGRRAQFRGRSSTIPTTASCAPTRRRCSGSALDTVDALVIHDLDAGYHGDELAQRYEEAARRQRHQGAARS